MSGNNSWRRSPILLQVTAALGALAYAHAQLVGFGICRYHSTTGFTDENIGNMTSEVDGYSLVLTTMRPSLRACQRLTLYSNGTFLFAHVDDYNEVRKYRGSFTTKMSTYTETGYIDLMLPHTVLDADILGNLRLYVLAVEDSYLVLASCINVGLVSIEQIHMFVPTSQFGTTSIEDLKFKLTEFGVSQLENVREVNQACAAGLRDGITSAFSEVSNFFKTLVRFGVIRPVLRQDVDIDKWTHFKLTHNKVYDSHHEDKMRLTIFNDNKYKIDQHNQLFEYGERRFKMKSNRFADLKHEEFLRFKTGLLYPPLNSSAVTKSSTFIPTVSDLSLPSSIDWRTMGAVTPVKDQGRCGSCYAFSTTGALEGQHFLKTGDLVSLSEQNIVDCSSSYGNHGCDGGLMDYAFRYIKNNGGINTNASYPYKGVEQACMYSQSNVGATVTGYMDIPRGSEAFLKAAVGTVGPVAVGIDASHESLQFYSSGVYSASGCTSDNINHAVLAVGYGEITTGKQRNAYWIVKNSWGTTWGDKGYFLLARNKNDMCGVSSLASFPLV